MATNLGKREGFRGVSLIEHDGSLQVLNALMFGKETTLCYEALCQEACGTVFSWELPEETSFPADVAGILSGSVIT